MAKEATLRREESMGLCEQLELDLRLPWGGLSPRVLTRASEAFRFGPEGMGRLDLDASRAGEITQEELGQLLLPFVIGG